MLGKIVGIENNIVIIKLNIELDKFQSILNNHVIMEEPERKYVGEIVDIKDGYGYISLLGELNEKDFVFGVIKKPSFGASVKLISKEKIPLIIGLPNYRESEDLLIGESAIYEGVRVGVNVNQFFSNHFAIFGSTGSGKSTLINLVPRFYDATDGEVLVDGINVKEYKGEALHNKIGYVPQKAVMFNGTVNSNISYGDNGKGEVTEQKIKEAIKVAQATEFVEKMDDKYDTHIAQGGTNVSGGQKQRLAIARAIARNPEIYIFDDSFSALDYKTDSVLRKELKKYTKDATSLIVAQRIGTIMNADKILVLDNGKCVGIGTHKELLKTCEVYKQIATSQLSKEELENA